MTIADKFNYLNNTKKAIKNALINKGVEVSDSDSFRSYADKVLEIQSSSGETVMAYYNGTDTKAGKKVLLTKVGYQALGDATIMPNPPKYNSMTTALANISENGYIVGIYYTGSVYGLRGFDIIDGTANLTAENSFSVDTKVVYCSPFYMLNGTVLGRSASGMTVTNSNSFVLNNRTNYYRGTYSTSTSSCYVFLDFCYYRTHAGVNSVIFNDDLTYTTQTPGTLLGLTNHNAVFYAAGSRDLFYAATSTTNDLYSPGWNIYKVVKDGDTYTPTLLRTYSYTPTDRFVDSSTIALGCKDSIKVGDYRLYFLVHKRNYLYFAINEVDESLSTFEVCEYPQNIKDILGTRTINKVQTFYDGTFSLDLSEGTTLICKFTDRHNVEILEVVEPFVIEGDSTIYHRCFSETKVYWYIEGLSDPISIPYYGYYDKVKAKSDYLALSPSEARFNSTILTGNMTGNTKEDNGRTMIEVLVNAVPTPETVNAYIPAEYTEGYAEGTAVLLNTKEYYLKETQGFSYTANRVVTNAFPLDNFMSVGYKGYAYMGQDSNIVSYNSTSTNLPTVFFPISQNTFVYSTVVSSGAYQIYHVVKKGGESVTDSSSSSKYPVVMLDNYKFGYIPFITPKDNPSEVNTIQYSYESNSSWTYIRVDKWNLESNTMLSTLKVGFNTSEKSSAFRNVGIFSTDTSKHLYSLFYDPTSLAFSTFLWDSENGFNQITQATTLAATGGFQYAVQFPNTLTINGEEVMYSFVYTGGDLHVYSFKESTMEWQEEPQIALTIKNALGGSFGNEVSIQPQVDGTLYCMNDLILAGFSFNEDGTITEVEHPCQKWLTDYPQGGIFASVNKFAKSACLLYANVPTQMQNVIYFNLEEHPDTGELQWVLYDKNRNNYAKESITGVLTGITGKTADGFDYVKVQTVAEDTTPINYNGLVNCYVSGVALGQPELNSTGTELEPSSVCDVDVLLTKVGYQVSGSDTLSPAVRINFITENGCAYNPDKTFNRYLVVDGVVDPNSNTYITQWNFAGNYMPIFMNNGLVTVGVDCATKASSAYSARTCQLAYDRAGNASNYYYEYAHYIHTDFGIMRSYRNSLMRLEDDLTFKTIALRDYYSEFGEYTKVHISGDREEFYCSYPDGLNPTEEFFISKFTLNSDNDTYTAVKIAQCPNVNEAFRDWDSLRNEVFIQCKGRVLTETGYLLHAVYEYGFSCFDINSQDESLSTFGFYPFPENIITALGNRTVHKIQAFYDNTFSLDLSEGTTLICKFTGKESIDILEIVEPFVVEGDSTVYHRTFSENKLYWYQNDATLAPISTKPYGTYNSTKATVNWLAVPRADSRWNSTVLTGVIRQSAQLAKPAFDDTGRRVLQVETTIKKNNCNNNATYKWTLEDYEKING